MTPINKFDSYFSHQDTTGANISISLKSPNIYIYICICKVLSFTQRVFLRGPLDPPFTPSFSLPKHSLWDESSSDSGGWCTSSHPPSNSRGTPQMPLEE